MQLEELLEGFQRLHRNFIHLERMKLLRSYLKIAIIGFFIFRDIEERISENDEKRKSLLRSAGRAVRKGLNSFKRQIEDIEKSNKYLSKDDEDRLVGALVSFETNLDTLKSIDALDEKRHSAALSEIERLGHSVVNHNQELDRRRLKQDLLKLRKDILQADEEIDSLWDSQRYLSRRQLSVWKKKWNHIAQPVEEFLTKGPVDIDFEDSIISFNDTYKRGEQLIEKHNNWFIEKEKAKFKDFFDRFESYPLTDYQRRAIFIDEESCLVVAGAGTGKTSTIVGKAGYLIKKGLAVPEEILLIAFNKDVATEMNKRVYSQLGKKLKVRTYHSLGLEIISQSKGVKPSVSELATDRVKLPKKILEFIKDMIADEDFSKIINHYFLFHFSPYKSMFEVKSWGEYIEYLMKFDIRSLKGDIVKSFEECDIANFLYFNGIDYEYEKRYEAKTADAKHRQYKPDFYLPEYGLYIEHFGIDREGKTAPYISQTKYNEEIKWKRKIHREHQTTLIETYSYEKQEETLLSNLEEKLCAQGVVFSPISRKRIFDKLNDLGKVDSLSLLLSTFLNLFKSCGKTIDDIRNTIDNEDTRTRTFLEIFSGIYDAYTSYLEETEEIDFNDMINMAESLVRQGKYISKFKYILVDEFQDISQSRYRFLKSLLDQNRAHLFCVGDDWQSIYRFTGSDLSIMLDFERSFEFNKKSYLVETFRFNDKLCDFSTKFILENPNQIEKRITTKKKGDKPSVTLIKGETRDVLADVISEINRRREGRETVFIIGRYNYLRPKYLREISGGYPELAVSFTTAHNSKGLEADNVILIGLTSGIYGFPCQIMDDPILNLVLAKQDPCANAEERRLFYVAITRARKHVYLVGSKFWASAFINEIEQNQYEINVIGDDEKTFSCPSCKTGQIVLREGKYGIFHSCSNYPYCEYMPKKCPECRTGFLCRAVSKYDCSDESCSFNADICPDCENGYLVVRKGRYGSFYGCSNYPECNYTKKDNYTRFSRSRKNIVSWPRFVRYESGRFSGKSQLAGEWLGASFGPDGNPGKSCHFHTGKERANCPGQHPKLQRVGLEAPREFTNPLLQYRETGRNCSRHERTRQLAQGSFAFSENLRPIHLGHVLEARLNQLTNLLHCPCHSRGVVIILEGYQLDVPQG